MEINQRIADLEANLNQFNPGVRAAALADLSALAEAGQVECGPEMDVANMHCHTFFSFNAYGYSPTGLAWLAKRRGFKLMGIMDFDVLDGVGEFLDACEAIGVRGSAGIETRTFVPEFATCEINSPGEPGICYHMGIGFTVSQVPESVAGVLAHMRRLVVQRNQGIVSRVNAYLDPVTIDYQRDVLPLTPGGNPTERHIVVAYVRAVERLMPSPAQFWAGKLGILADQAAALMSDPAKFQNQVRAKLMKQGGVGYVPPTHDAFPTVAEVNRLIVACGALPCAGWLDGLSAGEQAFGELLELMMRQGAVTLNIIPDRNWNIADPQVRQLKVSKLVEIVRLAGELGLPLNVGTEMNAFGQKMVDDFDVPEMRPLRQAFLEGSYFIYGHTILQRALGLGFQSEWAQAEMPDRRQRNAFYTRLGYAVPPGRVSIEKLRRLGVRTPAEIIRKSGVEHG